VGKKFMISFITIVRNIENPFLIFQAEITCPTCSGKAKDQSEIGIKDPKLTRVKPYSSPLMVALFTI